MAGTHGVKRPGGSALNAGQVGGLRAATYIVNAYGPKVPASRDRKGAVGVAARIERLVERLESASAAREGLSPLAVITEIQQRVTKFGGHVREIGEARRRLRNRCNCAGKSRRRDSRPAGPASLPRRFRRSTWRLTAAALFKAIVAMLEQGAGSRGSHIVLAEDGVKIHPDVVDAQTGKPLRIKPENVALRNSILRIAYDPACEDLFVARNVPIRQVPSERKSFEPAWADYRAGKIFK